MIVRGVKLLRILETYKDDLEQHLLVNLHEFLVPLVDVGGLLSGVGVILGGSRRISTVVNAPIDDLTEDRLVDIGDRDVICDGLISNVLYHIFDQNRALSDVTVYK